MSCIQHELFRGGRLQGAKGYELIDNTNLEAIL